MSQTQAKEPQAEDGWQDLLDFMAYLEDNKQHLAFIAQLGNQSKGEWPSHCQGWCKARGKTMSKDQMKGCISKLQKKWYQIREQESAKFNNGLKKQAYNKLQQWKQGRMGLSLYPKPCVWYVWSVHVKAACRHQLDQ
jgi:hypothetical protein